MDRQYGRGFTLFGTPLWRTGLLVKTFTADTNLVPSVQSYPSPWYSDMGIPAFWASPFLKP